MAVALEQRGAEQKQAWAGHDGAIMGDAVPRREASRDRDGAWDAARDARAVK